MERETEGRRELRRKSEEVRTERARRQGRVQARERQRQRLPSDNFLSTGLSDRNRSEENRNQNAQETRTARTSPRRTQRRTNRPRDNHNDKGNDNTEQQEKRINNSAETAPERTVWSPHSSWLVGTFLLTVCSLLKEHIIFAQHLPQTRQRLRAGSKCLSKKVIHAVCRVVSRAWCEQGVPQAGATLQEQTPLEAEVGGCDRRRERIVLRVSHSLTIWRTI